MQINVCTLQEKLGISVLYFDEIDSTNLYCKNRIKEGIPFEGVVIASKQTNGQGRVGKSFYSPQDSGLYLTFSIKIETFAQRNITPAIAVSVCRTIEKCLSIPCGLKWVNDIYIQRKKVGGILCQTVGDYLLIGIGINIFRPKIIPTDLETRLGWVLDHSNHFDSTIFIRTLYEEIIRVSNILDSELLEEYRKRCVHIGSDVEIEQNQEIIFGKCIGIDNSFQLLINVNDEIKSFSSGFMVLKI